MYVPENARSRYANETKASDSGEIFFLEEFRLVRTRTRTGTGTMATEVGAMKLKPLTRLSGAGRVSRPRAVVRGLVGRRRARFRVPVAHSSLLRATVADFSLEKKTNGQKVAGIGMKSEEYADFVTSQKLEVNIILIVFNYSSISSIVFSSYQSNSFNNIKTIITYILNNNTNKLAAAIRIKNIIITIRLKNYYYSRESVIKVLTSFISGKLLVVRICVGAIRASFPVCPVAFMPYPGH